MDLTRTNWPRGWVPSNDKINGDPQGLLRMENLHLEEDGVLGIVRGPLTVSTELSADISSVYAKYFGGTKYRYAALEDGRTLVDSGDFTSPITMITGGSPGYATFANYRGHVFAISNTKRFKDNGNRLDYNQGINELGIEIPGTAPGLEVEPQRFSDLLAGDFSGFAIDGSGGSLSTTGNVTFSLTQSGSADVWSGAVLTEQAISTAPDGVGGAISNEDTFSMTCSIGDTGFLTNVRIEFFLVAPDANGVVTDYYYKDFNNSGFPMIFNQGKPAITQLECYRSDFTRVGLQDISWDALQGIRISIEATGASAGNYFTDLRFYGGASGKLNGYYEFMQVNVHRNGSYVAYSKRGPISDPTLVSNGQINITPAVPTESQTNEIWIYRRSAVDANTDTNRYPNKLGNWYRCLQIVGGGIFPYTQFIPTSSNPIVDNTSDIDLLIENVQYNEGMLSLRYDSYDINENIYEIQSDFNGRCAYLTDSYVYFSEIDNPEGISPELTIKLSNENMSRSLWIKRVQFDMMYLGTTTEIYEISGTLQILADGTPDLRVKPLEVRNPPVTRQAIVYEGVVNYLAKDGFRAISGSQNNLISHPLNRLFEGHICHGVAPFKIVPNSDSNYPIAIAKHKLWMGAPLQNDDFVTWVYSFKKDYWYTHLGGVSCMYGDEDDKLLAGSRGVGARHLFEIDQNANSGMDILLQTTADCNQQPRNRKDTFTFGIKADSGNMPVTIAIAKDGSDQYYVIGSISFDGIEEKMITIAETIGLAKHLAVKIYGSNLNTFKLYRFTIEYEPRPEQLTYIRIPYTNLGTQSRKRFINYAFMIDTLGVDCEFFPLIDGSVAGPTSIVNFDRKGTHVHYFDSEQVGTDVGGIICGFFEFYGVNQDEIISEKMPAPTTYLKIPQSDFGQPNRKRHSSYKFIINTRGGNVRFTPHLDGTDRAPLDFLTNEKQTVEYFFNTDTISIDIGGTLESLETPKEPFEFYGPIVPQQIEVLPPRLTEFRIPENNYGVAARKRIRTIPMEINTNGANVVFTPIVDNVRYTTSTINTATRTTAFHYFDFDIFGVDYSGELVGASPFEFYGLMKPESVEVLPVAKRFDQIGPIRFDKLSKILALRIRMIALGDIVHLRIMNDESDTIPNMTGLQSIFEQDIHTLPNRDWVYEVPLRKTVNGTVFRIELGPTVQPFHRYDIQLKVNISGMDADPKWVKVS